MGVLSIGEKLSGPWCDRIEVTGYALLSFTKLAFVAKCFFIPARVCLC